jgi:hypothetical protein
VAGSMVRQRNRSQPLGHSCVEPISPGVTGHASKQLGQRARAPVGISSIIRGEPALFGVNGWLDRAALAADPVRSRPARGPVTCPLAERAGWRIGESWTGNTSRSSRHRTIPVGNTDTWTSLPTPAIPVVLGALGFVKTLARRFL